MKKLLLVTVSFTLLLVIFPGCHNDEWEYLFNGKNLNGWKQLNGAAKFEVIDGEIVGTTVPNTGNSFLATEKTYSDFILEVELLLKEEMNSGIQIRSESNQEYQKGRVHGYQCEVDPSDRAWSAGIYDEGRRGWLYPVDLNPAAKSAFKMGEWNRYHIECIGNSLRTWLNGVPVAHVVDDMTPEGFIALQVHAVYDEAEKGRQIRWRNIRIKTKNLAPYQEDDIYIVNLIPNDLSESEAMQGYKLLFDGKTTNGWGTVSGGSFPGNGWAIEDQMLTVLEAMGETDVATTEKFKSFELKFDFNLKKGADGGVKYCTGKNGSTVGLEYQITDDKNKPDIKEDTSVNHTMASVCDLVASNIPPFIVNRPGRWNRGRLIVFPDGSVEHWINGLKVVKYTRGDSIFNGLLAKSVFKKYENFGMAEESPILLNGKSGTIQFRSIKIKTLN